MEEARKQLEILKILKDRPQLLKRIEELEQKVNELEKKNSDMSSELSPFREFKKIIDDKGVTLSWLSELISGMKPGEILTRAYPATRTLEVLKPEHLSLLMDKEKQK